MSAGAAASAADDPEEETRPKFLARWVAGSGTFGNVYAANVVQGDLAAKNPQREYWVAVKEQLQEPGEKSRPSGKRDAAMGHFLRVARMRMQ